MEKYLIDYLRKNEYEVYIIKDVKKAKGVLAQYKESMCFVNIDSDYTYSEWFNFMKSFSDLPNLAGIYLGIVTETASWKDKDKFVMNIRLPGGFNQVSNTEKCLKTFVGILDLNGAKGRRKYLRLDTRDLSDVSGYMAVEGKLYNIGIKDLSSAGFAVSYKQDIIKLFQKNTLIRNLSLSAGRKSMVCSCIVFNTQVNPDGTAMSVLMLTNENPESTKTYIRDYIFSIYYKKMEQIISEADKDYANYSQVDEYSKLVAVRDRNYDELVGLDELEEPEELLEEVPGARNLDDDIL